MSLRFAIRDCVEKHLLSSAAFLADKLVTISEYNLDDVFLLADIYCRMRHFNRALEALSRCPAAVEIHPGCAYLQALSLLETGKHEECLLLLNESMPPIQASDNAGEISLLAAILVLKGRAYETAEQRELAAMAYSDALRADSRCWSALSRLVDGYLLPPQKLKKLISELQIPEDAPWLQAVYDVVVGESQSVATTREIELLQSNSDLAAAAAVAACDVGSFFESKRLANESIAYDPLNLRALPALIASLVETKSKTELFRLAHKLVEKEPGTALAWHAVGCYYLTLGKHEQARRALVRATAADGSFAPAWLAFGQAFAMADETDQALAAYRTAHRLFPGSPVPLLCVGIEYLRANNLALADQHFLSAREISPQDAYVLHELGVVAYKTGNYPYAQQMFEEALRCAVKLSGGGTLTPVWEPTVFSLGHAYRKQLLFVQALDQYQLALSLSPLNPSIYAAMGFAHHLNSNPRTAIDFYHKALAQKPDDAMISALLTRALDEEAALPITML